MKADKTLLTKDISSELKKLKKDLAEKNKELEIKNKDLEIESSLERVRTVSMSMKKQEDLLNICESLYKELLTLGFIKLRNTMINIFDDANETFLNYDYSDVIGKSITKIAYDIHPIIKKQIQQVRKKRNVYSETYFSIDDLKEWKKFRKNYGEKDDPRLNKAKVLYYHFYSVGTAAIGISCFDKISKDQKSILKRFRNVFDLAYGKYSDVTLAEAQARESQIEIALERVRGRTMSMHSSNELQDAAILLFEQIRDLGVNTGSCGFVICENEKKDATFRMSSQDGSFQAPFTMPHTKTFVYKKIYSAKESGKDFFELKVSGEKLKKNFDYLMTVPGIGEKIKALRKARFKFPETMVYNCAFFKQGYLSFHTHESHPEAHGIFKRFAKVFEQTYTRFLDLQKAEAQTREANIEAALEKVRGKAMAMHNSGDLTEAAGTVFTELNKLGINPIRSGFVLLSKDSRIAKLYPATSFDNKNTVSFTGEFEFTGHPVFEKQYQSWLDKENYFPVLEGDILKSYYKILAKGLSVPYKNFSTKSKKQFGTFLPFGGGFLFTWSDEIYSENEINILDRFKNILDLTIRRYLDLQNAEGQAKEAQIEAALERVRSRSMGMQKSAELKDVIQVVYEQFVHLNIDVEHTGFIMDYKANEDMNIWLADKNGVPLHISIPYFDSPHWNSFIHAKEKGIDFFANQMAFKEKNRFYKKLFKLIPEVPEKVLEFYLKCPGLAISTVLLDNLGLYIENFSGTPYTDEENNILMRFGKVFQQTYTRFLDLQKAEIQAKEAHTEAALERVRAKSMAMHKSEQLPETAQVLFEQFDLLGLTPDRMSIGIIDDKTKMIELWATDQSGSKSNKRYSGSVEEKTFMQKMYKAWKNGEDSIVVELKGEELGNWLEYVKNEMRLELDESHIKGRRVQQAAFFSHGILLVTSNEPVDEEVMKLLRRFAKVFNQTYTRFLDLQKAEAQTRESQTEAALERVRSQTMAMNKSQDLEHVVAVIFRELDNLNLKSLRCGIGIIDSESRSVNVWTTTKTNEGMDVNISGYESMDVHPMLQGVFEAWKRQEDFKYTLKGEDLLSYYRSMEGDNYRLPESAPA